MTSKWCPHEVTNQFRIVFIVRNLMVPDGSFDMYVIAAIMVQYSSQPMQSKMLQASGKRKIGYKKRKI
jgi:hypothetical protein